MDAFSFFKWFCFVAIKINLFCLFVCLFFPIRVIFSLLFVVAIRINFSFDWGFWNSCVDLNDFINRFWLHIPWMFWEPHWYQRIWPSISVPSYAMVKTMVICLYHVISFPIGDGHGSIKSGFFSWPFNQDFLITSKDGQSIFRRPF